eukprot:4840701-Amphidinium_carterae.1
MAGTVIGNGQSAWSAPYLAISSIILRSQRPIQQDDLQSLQWSRPNCQTPSMVTLEDAYCFCSFVLTNISVQPLHNALSLPKGLRKAM